MKMPELMPENSQAVYRYFSEFEPNSRVQDASYALMRLLLPTAVVYAGTAGEQIQSHLADGGSVILSANHQSNSDSLVLASVVEKEEPLNGLKGTTTIPAKVELFGRPIIGRVIKHVPAHPAFRAKNFKPDETGQKLRENAADAVVQFNIDYIDNGGNIAIFGEGYCNVSNPTEVQPLRSGIGRIAVGVKNPSNLLIANVGIAYKTSIGPARFRPIAVVGEPFCPEGLEVNEVLAQTHAQLQTLVTAAFGLAH